MPESSSFNALDTGFRRYDELIGVSLKQLSDSDCCRFCLSGTEIFTGFLQALGTTTSSRSGDECPIIEIQTNWKVMR